MIEEWKGIGLVAGQRRVGRLMRQNSISVVKTYKHKVTTDSNHKFNIAPKLLNRDFLSEKPNQKRLRQHLFRCFMSGRGNCFDNAVMETSFKTIKAEPIWLHTWHTLRVSELAIFEYINGFSDLRQRHSALVGKIPLDFERKIA